MIDSDNNMVKDFPGILTSSNYPWNENWYKVDKDNTKLQKEQAQIISYFCSKWFIFM
jgi:hypothetical protein